MPAGSLHRRLRRGDTLPVPNLIDDNTPFPDLARRGKDKPYVRLYYIPESGTITANSEGRIRLPEATSS